MVGNTNRFRVAFWLFVCLLTADLLFAQVAKRVIPEWRAKSEHAAYRIRHPEYHHGLKPNVNSTSVYGEFKARFITNSLAFRDSQPRQVNPVEGNNRILILGDSFTEGANLNYEKTFVGIIGEALSKKGYEVLNGAVASYAPSIYFTKLRHLVEQKNLQMTEVVIFLDLSDIWDEAKCYTIEPNGKVGNRCNYDKRWLKRFKKFLAEISLIYHTYRTFKDGRKENRRRKVGHIEAATNWDRARWTVDPELRKRIGYPGLEQSKKRLQALKTLCDKHGIYLTLVVYPWPDQIAAGDLNSLHVKFWRTWAKTANVRFVNLFPPFFRLEKHIAIHNYFAKFDFHFNTAGHALMAKSFLEKWSPTQNTSHAPLN